jgi:hypothetical protein
MRDVLVRLRCADCLQPLRKVHSHRMRCSRRDQKRGHQHVRSLNFRIHFIF